MSLTEKTNHVDEAIDNLIEQFKNKPKFQGFIRSFVNQVQELEQMFFQLLNDTVLDTAVGVQLDGIGSIVGEERQGRNDDDYRAAIRARILLNLSNGTPEDILGILSLLNPSTVIQLTEYFPAALTVYIVAPLTTAEAQQMLSKLLSAKPAGVLAHLIYGISPESELFMFQPKTWTASTAYSVGDGVQNDTGPIKVYICVQAGTSAGSGGPTGTGAGIVDGSCKWDYVQDLKGKPWDLGKWSTII